MGKSVRLLELQQTEKDALKMLIDFFNQNKLTYYLRGGSALGAVKYHDIIPWDDDIDVVLPRRDYNRLVETMPDVIGDFEFRHFSRDEKLNCYFARLYLNDSKRLEANLPRNNAYGLVLIDILPLDGLPDNRVFQQTLKFKVNYLRLLASVHTLDHKETVVKRKGIKKVIPELMNRLHIHKLYKQIDIYRKLDKVYAHNDYEKSTYVGVLAGSKGSTEVYPREWLGNGTLVRFDDISVRIPQKYDEYLKQLFGGDYMERNPQETERIQKHFEVEL